MCGGLNSVLVNEDSPSVFAGNSWKEITDLSLSSLYLQLFPHGHKSRNLTAGNK